jgi:hypothetical protein
LTNHTHKIEKEQLNRNLKYDNKRQLKRNGERREYNNREIEIKIINTE